MKKIYHLLLIALFFTFKSYGQAPFTTLAREPIHIVKDNKKFKMFDVKGVKDKKGEDFNELLEKEKVITIQDDNDSIDFFKNNSLALTVVNSGESRASIHSQVIFYKINIFTPIDKESENYTYNIPLMLISKLSTSYDSINASNSIDVLDYEAAPVTLRIMPSIKVNNNSRYKENLLLGFYADARGLNFYRPESQSHKLEVVGSGGVGFTFQGNGEAGFYNSNAEYESGKWLFSAMIQGACGKKEIIQSLFNTDKDYVTSFQSYFSFRINENNKFNLKVGFQHYFQETISGNKNNFSIAIGL